MKSRSNLILSFLANPSAKGLRIAGKHYATGQEVFFFFFFLSFLLFISNQKVKLTFFCAKKVIVSSKTLTGSSLLAPRSQLTPPFGTSFPHVSALFYFISPHWHAGHLL